ncbi:RNA-binding protein 33 isoform X2 [Hippocampus comes]|uniref:RNA-binding protein 33 isoform X2 n=1 Tax=Hippocampus comes TaxID=109280 RepID=UPI00094EF144|nr:PREDICTED: RNA-binding protein 33 isoform X2 [Hippocampus comes]
MSANDEGCFFDEYDKPGTERSRRRRGEDNDLESDLEDDLFEEFSPLGKKNLSEDDEELNDALLQSDEEEEHESFSLQGITQDFPDDTFNPGANYYENVDTEPDYPQNQADELYTENYTRDDVPEDQVDYTTDEVLDIQINEPIDGEFQDNEYQTYEEGGGFEQEVAPEEENLGDEQEEAAEVSQVFQKQTVENEVLPEELPKEESDDDEEEDGDSGRIRFKSERKDAVIVRLADAGNKRRNIPETLELSEKAKKDLELEQQERQKRQNRYGGRGGRGGGYAGFGLSNMRGGHRGRMNDHSFHLRGNMGLRSSRMPLLHLPHQQPQQHHHHHQFLSRPRGPHPFPEHGRPHGQQPLQPLITPHITHRSPPRQPQMEPPPPPRLMGSPPAAFGHPHNQQQQHHHHHHNQQPPQPKNIHINPHFRGSGPSSVPVPLMPPAPSQPRPAVGPQRFPGPGDFHQHMPNNFGQPQRLPHHMEPFRNQPHQGPQDREPLFMGGPERADPTSFPGQLVFDHPGPNPLMNTNLHQQQQMPAQGHMGFGPPGPAFGQPSPQGALGLFSIDPPRPSLPPPQGHQGLVGLNQQGPPPNQTRPFLNPRQPFNQQGGLFPPPQAQFGIQGLIHGPPQPPIQDSLPSHQPIHQQHHQQQPPHLLHHGQNLFQQQLPHGSPRQSGPRLQNLQQHNMANRQRMNTPAPKQIHPQRNSNLRELPIAPGNASITPRPAASLGANVRPVVKATQGVRPVQPAHVVPGGGRGRGQVATNAAPQPMAAGRTVVRNEIPSSAEPQDPEEDEETRQYRLKIEEQKRLREEILRRKELRRQLQAGVRKKELLDRINTSTQSQPVVPSPQPTAQQNQQAPPAPQLLLLPPPQQQPLERRQPLQLQQQRQRPQQPFNQSPGNPNGVAQAQTPRPNVKSRLQMGKGNSQQPQTLKPGPDQQWRQPPQSPLQQQRRTSGLPNVNKPGAPNQFAQIPRKNIPVTPALGPGQPQAQGLKPGAKRTVMQWAKLADGEGHQVPQKVRVVKLSGAPGKGPEATAFPVQQQQQQSTGWPDNPLRQGVQRKVTVGGGQQLHGAGMMQQVGRGGIGNLQQNRVVVPGRGRGGIIHVGRGGPMGARQGLRVGENQRRTVTIEGLSSSTTDVQLQSLLRSIGPIEMFRMIPQQRKAIATFSSPQHAASFQMSFHRHMIDLSHIDVKLIDG